MQADFHYYATYCASLLAGFPHEDATRIAYSANFVDCCTATILKRVQLPTCAATTQSQLELADSNTDIWGLQEITRIWSSFHFLPARLDAEVKAIKNYRDKFRLICFPNGCLVGKTVELAKDTSLEAVGVAMHVLADTWAHQNFAGTPSLVINNTQHHFFQFNTETEKWERIKFSHNVAKKDNFKTGKYINSIYQEAEHGIMNLGHGRAGHLPDYSFIKYKYMPAWGNYAEIVKDNPQDYLNAFAQMVYALKYLKGTNKKFSLNTYDFDAIKKHRAEIEAIIKKPQLDASEDWMKFGKKLSGKTLKPFDLNKYVEEYLKCKDKSKAQLTNFVVAAIKQKDMVTKNVHKSKNMLTGHSICTGKKASKELLNYLKTVNGKDMEVAHE
ncbi:MAG: hypothetical protein MJ152_00075 [Clostridia bacterium]|nr:hypothetical protein [Clostridia bacterium]